MCLIRIKNITKTYDIDDVKTHALRGISFGVKQGEFVAIMGPSGSGKSTLLHILGFLDRPSTGTYHFDEKSIHNFDDDELARFRNQKMGFVFQAFNLLPRTSVMDNVRLPLLYAEIPHEKQEEMALKAIKLVGLSDRVHHETSQLSGGEQQRVAIARALVLNPDVIFADEPTGNLDSRSGGQIMEYIAKLHSAGNTIVLITHERYTAEYAQRIIRLKDGLVEKDFRVKNHRQSSRQFIK